LGSSQETGGSGAAEGRSVQAPGSQAAEKAVSNRENEEAARVLRTRLDEEARASSPAARTFSQPESLGLSETGPRGCIGGASTAKEIATGVPAIQRITAVPETSVQTSTQPRARVSMADSNDSYAEKAPKFDGKDYSTWAFKFKMWAEMNDLWGFFDGTEPRPRDAEVEAQTKWDKANQKAFARLCLS
jgi:hypothetical protein